MEQVPLEVFVDFMMTRGPRKAVVVKQQKDQRWGHMKNFWGPLRDAITTMHAQGESPAVLDEMRGKFSDARKERAYRPALAGYRKFMVEKGLIARPPRCSPAPKTILPVGDIELVLTPDLCLEIDGVEHLIALHFGGVAIPRPRADILLSAMVAAWGPSRPGTRVAVLDVDRGHLVLMQRVNPRMPLVMRAEAASYAVLSAML